MRGEARPCETPYRRPGPAGLVEVAPSRRRRRGPAWPSGPSARSRRPAASRSRLDTPRLGQTAPGLGLGGGVGAAGQTRSARPDGRWRSGPRQRSAATRSVTGRAERTRRRTTSQRVSRSTSSPGRARPVREPPLEQVDVGGGLGQTSHRGEPPVGCHRPPAPGAHLGHHALGPGQGLGTRSTAAGPAASSRPRTPSKTTGSVSAPRCRATTSR